MLPDELPRFRIPATDDVVGPIISDHEGLASDDGPASATFANLGLPKDLGGTGFPVPMDRFG